MSRRNSLRHRVRHVQRAAKSRTDAARALWLGLGRGLSLEALEDRRLLTVVFNTQYGAETLVTSSPFTVLNSPPVHLLLWGSNWGTGAGQSNPTTVINQATTIINSTYLSGLLEYGPVGFISSIDSYVDTANAVPADFNPGLLKGNSLTEAQTELTTVINAHNLPAPGSTPPIYVIIVDPSHSSTNGGYNTNGTAANTSVNIASVGTDANFQLFGDTFSHEMAERISDPGSGGVVLDEPSTIPSSLLNDSTKPYNNPVNQLQIGDGEAEPSGQWHYTYQLDGVEVQPFWSNANSAFIAPDGNFQKLFLSPIWNTSTVTFNNSYNLTINGDQLSNKNDNIVISRDAAGGTQVNLNGEIANFDPQTSSFGGTPLNAITVNGGSGNDTVTIDYSNGNPIPTNGLIFNGNGGTNTIAAIGNTNFTLTNSSLTTGLGGVSVLSGVQVANLTGGAGGNSFNVSSWTGSGHIDGQGGGDTVTVTKNANITVSGTVLSASDGMNLSLANVEQANVTGGTGSNVFTVGGGASIFVNLAGGGGSDTLSLQGSGFSTINTYDSSADINTGFTDTQVSFSGISRLECHAGLGNTTYNIQNLTSGPSVYCYGGASVLYSTVMNIGSALIDSNGVQTYFYGGVGADTLVVPASSIDPATDFVVAGSQVIHNHAGNQREFNFDTAVEQISLVGGSGNDVFEVDDLAATNSVTASGNGGDDVLLVGYTDFDGSQPFSDYIKGNVTFHGGAGSNAIAVDDTAASSARSYELLNASLQATGKSGLLSYDTTQSVTLLGSAFADTFSFDGNIGSNLNINGQGGNDTFSWNAANNVIIDASFNVTKYSVTLTGGTGTDIVNVNDASRGEYNYTMYPDELIAYDINGSSSGEDFHYSQMESMSVTASADDNNFSVFGTSSLFTGQTSLFLGGGDDSATVYMRDGSGNPTILSNLGISGGSGGDNLYLVDPSNTGTTWTISNPFGASTQDFSVTGSALVGAGTDIEGTNVYGSSGDDTFNVNQYEAGSALGISGGDGNDTLNIGNGDIAATITSISAFTFDGQAGFNTFHLNNANETNAWFYTNTATSIQALRTSPATNYTVTLGQINVDELELDAGPNSDNLTLSAVAANEIFTFFGNNGNDFLNVNSPISVQGPVYFYGGGGTGNEYNNSANSDNANRTVHLDQTSLGAYPGDNYFGPGALYFSSLQAIVVTMGNGMDTVDAQPNATATVNIRGGNPTTAPGDTLNLALAGAANYVVTLNHPLPGVGTVTASNRQTLSYSGFEAGPVVDDVAPFIVTQGYVAEPVPRIVVQFSEDVSTSLSANSLDLIDVTTGQQVPPGLLAASYDSGTNTATFTFPGFAGGALPNDDYTAKIYGTLTDLFGNPMGVETPFNFTVAAPIVLLNAPNVNYSTSWNHSGPVTLASSLNSSISDPESATLQSLTVTLAAPQVGDVLAATSIGNVTVSAYDPATGVLLLSGVDTLADYLAVLQSVTYDNSAGGPGVGSEMISFVADDGIATSNLAMTTIVMGPVVSLNAPDVNYSTSWNNSGAVAIDSVLDASISDPDSASLQALTITLANPQAGDVLSATPLGNVTVTAFDPATGILLLSGTDTLANYLTVLQSVTYDNTDGGPQVTSETISVIADDGSVLSNIAIASITIQTPPVLQLDAPNFNVSVTWTNAGAVPIETGAASITDGESTSLNAITITLANPQLGDVLSATPIGNVTVTAFDPTTGVLLLSGTDSLINYLAALQSVTYDNTNGGPAVGSESITVLADDGTALSNIVIATINVNMPPVIQLNAPTTDYSTTWTDAGAVAIASGGNTLITDGESTTLSALTVTLASPQGGDVLSATPVGNVTVTAFDPATGILLLSGVDTLDNYLAALNSVTYDNTLGGPQVASESITVVADDGTSPSNVATATVDISVAPVVMLNAPSTNYSTSWNNSGAVDVAGGALGANALVFDGEGINVASLTVSVSAAHAGDALTGPVTGGGITVSGSGTGTLILSGSASVAAYQADLAQVQYNNTSGGPGVSSVTVNVVGNDGTLASNTATTTININSAVIHLNGVNINYTNPTAWATPTSANASELLGAVNVASSTTVTITDAESATLNSMTVALSGPSTSTGDFLIGSGNGNIHVSNYNQTTGVVIFTGVDTLAHYQTALESVKYNNASTLTGPGKPAISVTVTANDGIATSNVPVGTVNIVQAPKIQLNVGTTNYNTQWSSVPSATAVNITGAGPISAAGGFTAPVLSSAESANLSSMTVTITSPHAGDILTGTPSGAVTVTAYNPTTGQLVLSGTATPTVYQTVLGSVKYNNTSGGPGVGVVTVTVKDTDGTLSSNTATATVNINTSATIPSIVSGTYLFYDHSAYSGGLSGAINLASKDNAAIDPLKTGYLGSALATVSNVSGFTLGVTGIMFDLTPSSTAQHNLITAASDLTLRVSGLSTPTLPANWNTPSSWSAAPAPASLTVRAGGGAGGSDRVEITWNDNAIKNEWLEVTVKAEPTGHTGLATSTTFFFGNLAGMSGVSNAGSNAIVGAGDDLDARLFVGAAPNPVYTIYDYNKSKAVGAEDPLYARNNQTTLRLLNVLPANFAPDAGGNVSPSVTSDTSSVTSALASAATNSPSLNVGPTATLQWFAGAHGSLNLNTGASAQFFEALGRVNTSGSQALLKDIDQLADIPTWDDRLLDSLLAELGLE